MILNFNKTKKAKKINLVLFLNNQRGYKSFLYLKKKSKFNIVKIFLSKKFLNRSVFKKLEKFSPKIIDDPNKNSVFNFIKKKDIDFSLVCGFPYIFDKKLLNAPNYCTLNLHGGKLPEYRGGSPLNWQIINNEKYIGISVIKMVPKIDKGPIISETKFLLKENYDIKKVHSIVDGLFPKLLFSSIEKIYFNPKIILKRQNEKKSNYFKQRTEKDGKIDWKDTAINVFNLTRAITKPYPCAYTFDDKIKKVKIIKCKIYKKKKFTYFPGKVSIIKDKVFIDCWKGIIQVLKSSRRLKNGEILI